MKKGEGEGGVEVRGGSGEHRVTRLRFLPRQPENQEVELLVLALLGLTGNAEVFRRGKVCDCVCVDSGLLLFQLIIIIIILNKPEHLN